MLLAVISGAWQDVGATRSRTQKATLLADVLRRLEPDELAAGTALLAGEPRQGRIGVGWATLREVSAPAASQPALTVTELDRRLEEIAAVSGAGSVARRQQLLADLLGRATAVEQEWLRALLLGALRQGALEGVVVEALARATGIEAAAIRRAAMLGGDLTAAAVAATTGGAPALAAFRLTLLRPVQPMLAQSAPDLAGALAATGPALVEAKLDGMRVQIHRRGEEVRVFTRSLRDVTRSLPAVVAVARSLDVDEAILDGEALALGPDGRPRAFQDSMTRDAGLQPFLFDALRLDGRDLVDEPLAVRAALLEEAVPAEQIVRRVRTDDADIGTEALRAALLAGHEGVVVKSLDAPYEAGRRGAAWVKVKPAHTLDLVVVAVEWGSGRRHGWLSNLHLAARDGDGFAMLGKTFKGMTDDMLAWQTEQLLAREVSRDRHIVHVRPELVVEIAFDGVQSSRRYPSGLALRFARVKRYRPDKSPDDADTLATVRAIHRGELTPPLP